MSRPSPLPYVWMLAGAFAFACMGALTHGLKDSCDWRVIALARTGLALVFASAYSWATGSRLVIWGSRALWLRSIAGSISLVATFFALTQLPIADVLTVTNLFPVWVVLLSWPMLGERPPKGVWISVASGVVGVALMQQPHLAEGNPALWAALVASFTSALAMIGLHQLSEFDVRAVVTHFSAVGTCTCTAALALFGTGKTTANSLTATTLAMLLGVGVTATLGQVLLTKAFVAGPPAKVSVVALSQVGFGMLFDAWFWGRSFSPISLVGMVLVVAPTCWIMLVRPPGPEVVTVE